MTNVDQITQKTLIKVLRYDERIGVITDADSGNNVVDNRVVNVCIQGVMCQFDAPSVAWLLKEKVWPEYGVVLVNQQQGDGWLRWSNLKKQSRRGKAKDTVKVDRATLVRWVGRLVHSEMQRMLSADDNSDSVAIVAMERELIAEMQCLIGEKK